MGRAPRPAYSRGESVYGSFGELAALPGVTREWAWGGATGEGVRVAVIDSGIQVDHPALEGSVDADAGVALHLGEDGEVVEEPGPHEDLFGHGTACASIIHSIAPAARFTSVRVLGAGLTGRSVVFLRGLAWAIANGFDVINLSLGSSKRDWALPFYELCDEAYFNDCFLVTAANNVAAPSFPGLYSSVASVACNVAKDPFEFHFNTAPPVEFLAPGIDLDVAWRNGKRIRSTGNSYAAPHLTGIAALIRSKHPGLPPSQVKAVLRATASNAVEPGPAEPAVRAPAKPAGSPRAQSAIRPTPKEAAHGGV